MSCISLDLTIDKVLADPVIGAAMRADHVDPARFETLLRTTARRLDIPRRADPTLLGGLAERVRCAASETLSVW